MPRIKFEDHQLVLIKDSLNLRYDAERSEYHKILCEAIGYYENFDISKETSVDSGIFLTKKAEALAKHEKEKDIHQARINLFESEHKGVASLTEEETAYITNLKGKRAIEEAIIHSITEKYNLLIELQKLINSIEAKTAPKPAKEPHPISDFTSPNDRLLGPTDTLIG